MRRLEYPTPEELESIRKWPIAGWKTCEALLDHVHGLWWNTEWGWTERPHHEPWGPKGETREQRVFSISTGGWSGNEDLVEAMQENRMFWSLCWWMSRKGGHFEFRVTKERP